MQSDTVTDTPHFEKIDGVIFYGFTHAATRRHAGYVGLHPDGRVFCTAKLYPGGAVSLAEIAAEQIQSAVWHMSEEKDNHPYFEAKWLREQITALDPNSRFLSAVDSMVFAVREAANGKRSLIF